MDKVIKTDDNHVDIFHLISLRFNMCEALSRLMMANHITDVTESRYLMGLFEKALDAKVKARLSQGKDKNLNTEVVWKGIITRLIHKGYVYDKKRFGNIQNLAKEIDKLHHG